MNIWPGCLCEQFGQVHHVRAGCGGEFPHIFTPEGLVPDLQGDLARIAFRAVVELGAYAASRPGDAIVDTRARPPIVKPGGETGMLESAVLNSLAHCAQTMTRPARFLRVQAPNYDRCGPVMYMESIPIHPSTLSPHHRAFGAHPDGG
jgi:hypothetical protein